MLNIIKYPIQEVDLKKIRTNRVLSLGISQAQKILCRNNIVQYGLVTPIVLMENAVGELTTLMGENELEVLRSMDVKKSDAFVTKIETTSDSSKAILMLASLKKSINPLAEGMLLKEIIQTGKYKQEELAELLVKSKSWVSKRLTLVEKLNQNVAEMVLSKQLCPSVAQEISRIPAEVQHAFAMSIYSNSIPKSSVEQLVRSYNDISTNQSLKDEIIKNPLHATEIIPKPKQQEFKKVKNESTEDLTKKLSETFGLMVRLIAESELLLIKMSQEQNLKSEKMIVIVAENIRRFLKLLENGVVSLGKQGGEPNGNN